MLYVGIYILYVLKYMNAKHKNSQNIIVQRFKCLPKSLAQKTRIDDYILFREHVYLHLW